MPWNFLLHLALVPSDRFVEILEPGGASRKVEKCPITPVAREYAMENSSK